MSKCDVDIPPKVYDVTELRDRAMDIITAEFGRLWPDECEGGDPTFIFHRGKGILAPGRVLYWGIDDRRDAYITGFLRGACRVLLLNRESTP